MIADVNGVEFEFPDDASDGEVEEAINGYVDTAPAASILAGEIEEGWGTMKSNKVAAKNTFTWDTVGAVDMSPDEDVFAQHISTIETGGLDNTYIRTQVKGSASSAYGPYQITRGLLKGTMQRMPDLLSPEEADAMGELIERQEVALTVGGRDKAKYAPGGREAALGALWAKAYGYKDVATFLDDFDYGGTLGLASNPEFQYLYENVARKLLKQHLADAGGDMVKAAAVWHGGPKWKSAASKGDTLAYMNRMKKLLGGDGA